MTSRMTTEEAIVYLRGRPDYADLIRDVYIGADVVEAAERFAASAEFDEVRRQLGDRLRGAAILDLGAGNGIASYAFAKWGARQVYALEPSASQEIGRGAIAKIAGSLPIEILDAAGEAIPLGDATVDIVYGRQVLHHIHNLSAALKECARVLRPGGIFLACREHVVRNARDLAAFLARHPVHKLAGGENAYRLSEYCGAIQGVGLVLEAVIGPWDSIINFFPVVRTPTELAAMQPKATLRRELGWLGAVLSYVPGLPSLVNWRRTRLNPGRIYTFLARKP